MQSVPDALGDDEGPNDLATMTKAELAEKAKELGVKVGSKSTKTQLIEAIKQA